MLQIDLARERGSVWARGQRATVALQSPHRRVYKTTACPGSNCWCRKHKSADIYPRFRNRHAAPSAHNRCPEMNSFVRNPSLYVFIHNRLLSNLHTFLLHQRPHPSKRINALLNCGRIKGLTPLLPHVHTALKEPATDSEMYCFTRLQIWHCDSFKWDMSRQGSRYRTWISLMDASTGFGRSHNSLSLLL